MQHSWNIYACINFHAHQVTTLQYEEPVLQVDGLGWGFFEQCACVLTSSIIHSSGDEQPPATRTEEKHHLLLHKNGYYVTA